MDYQSILLLVIGFGFIVFVHELGHFLAAKYVGIRCEQFALGFGQAILSYRKGIGVRVGSTAKVYEKRVREHLAAKHGAKEDYSVREFNQASDELGLGETEYRWNWIPLGGYVKMLGQDDTKPGIQVEDPGSYTRKSVGARMLVISAGVIMNILFAGIAFMILFMTGLKVPQAVVGGLVPMAPAQMAVTPDGRHAPLQVGDKILSIDGSPSHNDFRKIALNTALAKAGESLEFEVQRVDGRTEKVLITPKPLDTGAMQLLGIGVMPSSLLRAQELTTDDMREQFEKLRPERRPLNPGDRITQVQGQDVKVEEYHKLDEALQKSDGKPVEVTITSADGKTRQGQIHSMFDTPAVEAGLNFAGMQPQTLIASINEKSTAFGKLKEDDIVLAVRANGDLLGNPSASEFTIALKKAGSEGGKVGITVLREGKELTFNDLEPNLVIKTSGFTKEKGLGIGIGLDEQHAVISRTLEKSPTAAIPRGSVVRAVNGVEVQSWADVLRELRKAESGKAVAISAQTPGAKEARDFSITLAPADAQLLHNLRYAALVPLDALSDSRTTKNPAEAAWWGVLETRDSILQVYVTLQRLFQGSVPFSGITGPLGMFQMGTKIAQQGMDYLLWFLAIISANLAVVNFLPIPVVDGGHFLFLMIEKLRGRPVSERTMVLAQYVGLGLILTVFVAVTYQDILRLLVVH